MATYRGRQESSPTPANHLLPGWGSLAQEAAETLPGSSGEWEQASVPGWNEGNNATNCMGINGMWSIGKFQYSGEARGLRAVRGPCSDQGEPARGHHAQTGWPDSHLFFL